MRARTVGLALSLGLAVTSVACSSCGSNVSGHRAALRQGQSLEQELPRGSPVAPLAEACATPEASREQAPAPLVRAPYLQRVTASSAHLLWTAKTEEPFEVTVRRAEAADGSEPTTVRSRIDRDASPRSAHQHVAVLDGLEADAVYCYSLRLGGREVLSSVGMRTAPAPGADRPVRFVAFGDSGWGGADQWAVRRQLDRVPFDLMVLVGDVVYDEGTRQQYEERFFDIYDPLLRFRPIFPVTGNHDYQTDEAGPFREVFALPEDGVPAQGRERWFSFDWGRVHFVALDTERVGPRQREWLARDLRGNDLPWVVVYLHRPPFSSGPHETEEAVRRTFVTLFEEHEVALVLAGHDHHYERTEPIEGVTYVVTGGGGRGVRTDIEPQPFSAHAQPVLHFVWVEVKGRKLRLYAVDAEGTVFDAASIARPATR